MSIYAIEASLKIELAPMRETLLRPLETKIIIKPINLSVLSVREERLQILIFVHKQFYIVSLLAKKCMMQLILIKEEGGNLVGVSDGVVTLFAIEQHQVLVFIIKVDHANLHGWMN
jgi:hypothetical protein